MPEKSRHLPWTHAPNAPQPTTSFAGHRTAKTIEPTAPASDAGGAPLDWWTSCLSPVQDHSAWFPEGHRPGLDTTARPKQLQTSLEMTGLIWTCALYRTTPSCLTVVDHTASIETPGTRKQSSLVKRQFLKWESIIREKLVRENDGRLHATPSRKIWCRRERYEATGPVRLNKEDCILKPRAGQKAVPAYWKGIHWDHRRGVKQNEFMRKQSKHPYLAWQCQCTMVHCIQEHKCNRRLNHRCHGHKHRSSCHSLQHEILSEPLPTFADSIWLDVSIATEQD